MPAVSASGLPPGLLRRVSFGGGAQVLERAVHVVPRQSGFLGGPLASVDRLHDPVLEIGGEALVEPAVGPDGVGDEVARPAVGELVRDEADQAAVAGDEGRRQESEGRVLHAAIGKGRRQHDDVVATPAIGPVETLGRLDHAFGVGQLGGGAVEHRRLGPDPGARAELAEGEVAGRDRDQIGRDRMVHSEAESAPAVADRLALGRQPLARHHHLERLGRGHPRLPGLADAGAVLGGDPGAVEGRLPLAEQESVTPPRGLLRSQPLQGLGIGRGAVADGDAPGS